VAPGGDLNAHLMDKIKNAIASGLPVTHMLWDQGVADLGMDATTWRDHFLAMVGTIRPSTRAPIYVAKSATCSIRSGNMTPAQIDQLTRNGPNVYVAKEIHKSWIRQGPQLVVNGSGDRRGLTRDQVQPGSGESGLRSRRPVERTTQTDRRMARRGKRPRRR
jgi:hypothetical protein